jgi:hypothetical protein
MPDAAAEFDIVNAGYKIICYPRIDVFRPKI